MQTWSPLQTQFNPTRQTIIICIFCHTCSLCRVELVVQFPARGSTQVLLYLFPGVLLLWHFLYSVGPYPVSSLHIYTFVVSREFMAGAASQTGDADSSRAPCLTSGLQGSVNVDRGALLLVPQWQCISSFVFYCIEQMHQQLLQDVWTIKSHDFKINDVYKTTYDAVVGNMCKIPLCLQ